MKADAALPKPVVWMGSSLRDLCALGDDVQDEVGFALYEVQRGQTPSIAKPLKGFGGAQVQELVVDDRDGTCRCVYTIKFVDAIYVLHSFQKKSKSGIATPKAELDLVKGRLKQAQAHYEKQFGKGRP